MQESFYKTLGQKLKASRKAKGITLTELAEAVHRSPASLSKYENGEVNIAIDALVEICTALNVDISELLPATYVDLKNADILKYEKHLIERLYIYWYNGEEKKVKKAMIENSHPSMKSKIYFVTDAENSEYQSDFIYHGTVSYSDTSIPSTTPTKRRPLTRCSSACRSFSKRAAARRASCPASPYTTKGLP